MRYGFTTMDNKDVFFHVNNVCIGKDYTLKQGDEVSFILDEYDKWVIDVQFLPSLSDFQSTSDTPICEVESHPGDESWETVDSDSESEERTPSGPPSEVPDKVNDTSKQQDMNTDTFSRLQKFNSMQEKVDSFRSLLAESNLKFNVWYQEWYWLMFPPRAVIHMFQTRLQEFAGSVSSTSELTPTPSLPSLLTNIWI